MIRGTAVERHADETGHTEFKPSPFTTGTVDCQQCPWQYPPAIARTEAEQHGDQTEHLVSYDAAGKAKCTVCAWPGYDVPAAAIADPCPAWDAGDGSERIPCAYHSGHPPIEDDSGASADPWDHANPDAGVMWNDAEPDPADPQPNTGRYVRMIGGPRDGQMIAVADRTIAVDYPVMRLNGSMTTITMPIEVDIDGTPVIRWAGPVEDPPTDPAPAMGPAPDRHVIDYGADQICRCSCGVTSLRLDSGAIADRWADDHRAAAEPANTDPGPEPTDPPEVPTLNLKSRIDNAIDAYAEAHDRGDPIDLFELADRVHAVVGAGADWTPRTEAAAMTPAQALAFILDLPEWSRISRLQQLLDQAEIGSQCFVMDHKGAVEERIAMRIAAQRYHDALMRIARYCSTVDQPETAGQNVIGQIAAEALVQRD